MDLKIEFSFDLIIPNERRDCGVLTLCLIEKGQRHKITLVEMLEQSAYIFAEHKTFVKMWRRSFSKQLIWMDNGNKSSVENAKRLY